MKTIQVSLIEPVLKEAEALALAENVSLEHLVSTAATYAISHWVAERSGALSAHKPDRRHFLEMLEKALQANKTT